jgi:hypothetical protein
MHFSNNDCLYFELKSNGDVLRVDLIGLSHPNSQLDWDRRWVKSLVTLKVGGFSGEFKCDLRIDDFESFKDELLILYDKLDGTALFETLEGQLTINIKGDGIGHLEAKCSAMDFVGTGNKLDFEISFDQTIIPRMVRQLENVANIFQAN